MEELGKYGRKWALTHELENWIFLKKKRCYKCTIFSFRIRTSNFSIWLKIFWFFYFRKCRYSLDTWFLSPKTMWKTETDKLDQDDTSNLLHQERLKCFLLNAFLITKWEFIAQTSEHVERDEETRKTDLISWLVSRLMHFSINVSGESD